MLCSKREIWLSFLTPYNGVAFMLDDLLTSNKSIELFKDRADGLTKGMVFAFNVNGLKAAYLKNGR